MRQADSPQAATSGSRVTRALTFVGLSVLLVLALVAVDVAVLGVKGPLEALSPHYYMALGDSLSFGYQPNLDFSSGFVDDIYTNLHSVGVTDLVNDACAGETTYTMINGGCVARFAHKGAYTGAQLQAAITFLKDSRHQGRVSPVTLEIGVNDVFADWNATTCSVSPNASVDLATMDFNLTNTILPELLKALATPTGATSGDLHLLNYYNPFAKECGNSAQFVHLLNDHLQKDAAQFRIPVVDVYTAFGGDAGTADNICDYTWMCDARFHDIHPTNKGYSIIADAVERALGLPGTNPLTGDVAPPRVVASVAAAQVAAFLRRAALPAAA
jgi:lysophospholipase L1-like esterase